MSFMPQHETLPFASTAQVTSAPVAICFTPLTDPAFTAFFALLVVPSPSSPK